MKKLYSFICILLSSQAFSQDGTAPDVRNVIVGSQVTITVSVVSNDILNVNRTYTLDTFFYSTTSTPPNISVQKVSSTSLSFRDNQSSNLSDDTVYYVAMDQFGARDTNYLVVHKDNLSLDLYPGDCNHDHVCNHIDVLSIGTAYGKSQITREGIYYTDNWGPVRAYDWTLANLTSNYKHIDADGNGFIDSMSDMGVIRNNYNKTGQSPNIQYSPAGGDSFHIAAPDTLEIIGSSVHLPISIHLGQISSPLTSVYGVAFTVKYDTSYYQAKNIQFNPSKWFSDAHNTLNFAHVNPSTGEIDLAIVRRDGSNKNGSGELGVIDIVVDDVLGGLTKGVTGKFEVIKPVLIDSTYRILPVMLASAKHIFMVKKSTVGIQNTSNISPLMTQSPNSISMSNIGQGQDVRVYNMLGQDLSIDVEFYSNSCVIHTQSWNKGIYFIQCNRHLFKFHKY